MPNSLSDIDLTDGLQKLNLDAGGMDYEAILHALLCCGILSFLCYVHMESTWSKLNPVVCLAFFPLPFFIKSWVFLSFSLFPFLSPSAPVLHTTLCHFHRSSFSSGPLYRPTNTQGKVAVTGS